MGGDYSHPLIGGYKLQGASEVRLGLISYPINVLVLDKRALNIFLRKRVQDLLSTVEYVTQYATGLPVRWPAKQGVLGDKANLQR